MERGLSCAVASGMQVERVGRGRGVGREGQVVGHSHQSRGHVGAGYRRCHHMSAPYYPLNTDYLLNIPSSRLRV